jgi:hypothetical protein
LLDRQVGPLEVGRVGQALALVLGLGHFVFIHEEGIDGGLVNERLVLLAASAAHCKRAGGDEDHLDAALGGDGRQRLGAGPGTADLLTA